MKPGPMLCHDSRMKASTGSNDRHPAAPAIALAIVACGACTAALAEDTPPRRGTAAILEGSAPSDWRDLDAGNTLYMELDRGRVIIELAPRLAPQHVANIKALVREGFFDGLAIYRAQDNWVVQWGDADEKRVPRTARTSLAPEFTKGNKK